MLATRMRADAYGVYREGAKAEGAFLRIMKALGRTAPSAVLCGVFLAACSLLTNEAAAAMESVSDAASSCEESYSCESDLPRLDALVFDVDGDTIYGQILVPSAKFGGPRPCAIICHGFAGFTRWDDVAHDLCRAGIVAVIPHHRGAWGSEGEYAVSGCIRDAEALAAWAMGNGFAGKYNADTNAVYIVGHSMGGNSAVNAAARLPGLRGIALIAPCDIGSMALNMPKDEMLQFLIGEGLHVLKRKSDDAVVDDIFSNAAAMRFAANAPALATKKVFLAIGQYDTVVPTKPLDDFWAALGGDAPGRKRITYPATHSLLGARIRLASDLRNFIFH